MSSTPAFDFQTFLSAIRPSEYNIEHIDGGRVNITVRVTPGHDANDDPQLRPAPSHAWLTKPFIAKYAPPTLRYPGPEIPFSPVRLAIEARALALLSQDASIPGSSHQPALLPGSTLPQLGDHPQIVVPELLHYSPEQHVLLQTDLGALVPLADWLFATTSPSAPSLVGAALGRFLGSLNAVPPVEGLRTRFANPDADAVLFAATVRPLRGALARCGVRDADALGDALERVWLQFDADNAAGRVPADRLAFAHGDMWHSNVFVVPGALPAQVPRLAVIDWEFAGVGRVGLDIARMSAYLFLFAQSSRAGGEARGNLQDFAQGLVRAFKREFPQIGRPPAMESFCMLYGLHLCNGASWLRWCDCPHSGSGSDPQTSADRESAPCAHTTHLVHIGASWLRYGLDSGSPRPSLEEHPVRFLFDEEASPTGDEPPALAGKRRCCDWSALFQQT